MDWALNPTPSTSTRHRDWLQLMWDMPVIPLYYYGSRYLVNTRLTGYVDNVRDIHLSRYLDMETIDP